MPRKPAIQTTDKRRARGDITRARIALAGLEIASVEGIDGVTIGRVAEAAQVSKGHLSLLFGNREALQLAVLDAGVEAWNKNVRDKMHATDDPLQQLRVFCFEWLHLVERRALPGGCLITAAASEFRAMPGGVHDRLSELRWQYRERLRRLIAAVLAPAGSKPSEIESAVNDILAYQAFANVATFLDGESAFTHARRRTRELIDALATRLPTKPARPAKSAQPARLKPARPARSARPARPAKITRSTKPRI